MLKLTQTNEKDPKEAIKKTDVDRFSDVRICT